MQRSHDGNGYQCMLMRQGNDMQWVHNGEVCEMHIDEERQGNDESATISTYQPGTPKAWAAKWDPSPPFLLVRGVVEGRSP